MIYFLYFAGIFITKLDKHAYDTLLTLLYLCDYGLSKQIDYLTEIMRDLFMLQRTTKYMHY
jgi:hypothetical protein